MQLWCTISLLSQASPAELIGPEGHVQSLRTHVSSYLLVPLSGVRPPAAASTSSIRVHKPPGAIGQWRSLLLVLAAAERKEKEPTAYRRGPGTGLAGCCSW